MKPGPARLVAVGRLGRPHGVKGEIRLDPMGTMPRGLAGYGRFFIDGGVEVRIDGWRANGDTLLLQFAGIRDRDEVSALTGKSLFVPREDLPPLGEGEYYHTDLISAAVVDEEGRELGVVADVLPWGDYDMLSIRTGGKTWMLPVIGQYVLEIAPGRIVARVPEGLGP